MAKKKNETSDDTVSFTVSDHTVLAVSILLASVILAGGMIYSAGTVNSGLANLSIIEATKESGTGSGTGNLENPDTGGTNTGETATGPTAKLSDLVDDGFTIGSKDAPVVIVEYSDFQCPFCTRFFTDSLPQITSEYIDTGKVRLVYKHFPLRSIHPNAQKAGEAFECAVDQGKGKELHDALFTRQDEWVSIGVSKIKEIAAGIVGDSATFDSCLDNGDKKSIVDSHYNEITTLGGTGTPSFIVGPANGEGQLIVGAQPFSTFQSVVDSILS